MKNPVDFYKILQSYITGLLTPRGMPTVKQFAGDLDVSDIAVYKWLEGDNDISVRNFIRMYRSAKKLLQPVLRWLVRACDPALDIIDVTWQKDINGDFREEQDGITIQYGKLTEYLRTALADNRLDDDEKDRLRELALDVRENIDRFIHEIDQYPGASS